jgi:hypothetical protein
MERKGAEKMCEMYFKENPQIVGKSELPKTTCNIF